MHRVDRFPRRRSAVISRGAGFPRRGIQTAPRLASRSVSRSAARSTARDQVATAAPARRKKQSRLKISATAGVAVRTEGRKAAPPAKAAAVKLAAGTERATAAKAAPARAAAVTTAVETLEIRPSGTVVSRRPAVKRPAIHHVPHHPVLPPFAKPGLENNYWAHSPQKIGIIVVVPRII